MKKILFWCIALALITGLLLWGRIVQRENKIDNIISQGYRVENDKIFIYYHNNEIKDEIKGADLYSFEPLEENYSKDKNYVYLWARMIEGADPASFKMMQEDRDYGKDKNGIYYEGVEIKGADPSTFQLLKKMKFKGKDVYGTYYAIDSHFVYHHGQKIEGSDSKTFELINERDGRDKNGFYLEGKKVDGVDAASVQILSDDYSKDANAVYFTGFGDWRKKTEIDLTTFKIVDEYHVKDKNFVYYRDRRIEGADPTTFIIVNDLGKDKNGVYYKDFKLYGDIDPEKPFTFIGDYELTGFIDIIHRECQEDCMGEPYSIEYVFFQVIDADNKNIFALLKDYGNSFIGDKKLGLGCYDKEKDTITSVNFDDSSETKNLIFGKDLQKLLASSKKNPVKMKVTRPTSSDRGEIPNCSSFYRNFKVLD